MFEKDFVIVDLETTGLSPQKNEIIEIGAIKVKDGEVVDTMDIFIKPKTPVSGFITRLTGITNEMLESGCDILDGMSKFSEFSEGYTLVAHNARFDMGFLNSNMNSCFNKNLDNKCLDTLKLSKELIKDLPSYKLESLANFFYVDYTGAHRALKDCEITLDVYNNLAKIQSKS